MRKLLLCFFVAAIALCAADFTGKWSGTLTATDPNGEAHDGSAYLTLQQTGDTLTGSGGPNEEEQHSIKNGKVDGDTITFTVSDDHGDLHVTLHLDGETLSGDVIGSQEGEKMTAKVKLTRVKS